MQNPAAEPKTQQYSPWRLSVAPMMDWTDRHCRFLHRLISPNVRLYSEMVVDQAVIHGKRERLLGFDPSEAPVALQLGGCDPVLLGKAAAIGLECGYDELNLNCGCPSDRVQSGRFGACMMLEPEQVAVAMSAMREAVRDQIPVTVKCRLGVDDHDSEEFFRHFVETVAAAGTSVFVVHARKALLKGLSPKENREVPPLNYERVYALKRDLPELTVVLNGGLDAGEQTLAALAHVDGVMLGRHAYHNPWSLAGLERQMYADDSDAEVSDRRAEIVADYAKYMERRLIAGDSVRVLLRPLIGMFQGEYGARGWRRALSAPDLSALREDPGELLQMLPGLREADWVAC